jgi:hypothetical protein
MGDVEKDVDRSLKLKLDPDDKLRIVSQLDSFVIRLFKERIKQEHPKASPKQLLKILREELYYGRRDNI